MSGERNCFAGRSLRQSGSRTVACRQEREREKGIKKRRRKERKKQCMHESSLIEDVSRVAPVLAGDPGCADA